MLIPNLQKKIQYNDRLNTQLKSKSKKNVVQLNRTTKNVEIIKCSKKSVLVIDSNQYLDHRRIFQRVFIFFLLLFLEEIFFVF